MSAILGVLLVSLLLAAAASLWSCMMPVGLSLLPIHSKRTIRLRRKILSAIGGTFLDFTAAMLTNGVGRTELVMYLSPSQKSNMKPGMCYAWLLGMNSRLFIVLKDGLKWVPVFGWAMQLMQFIFLARDRVKDVPLMTRSVAYLLKTVSNPAILIFPEGTDLSDSNKQKSRAFSEQAGLPVLNEVLHPKSGGLGACLASMRGKGLFMHDMTIAYVDHSIGHRASEVDILHGKFPKEVHMFVDVVNIDDLPTDKSGLDQWLRESFYRKEALLRDFYGQVASTGKYTWQPTISLLDLAANRSVSVPPPYEISAPSTSVPVLRVAAAWALSLWLLWHSVLVRWLVACLVMAAMGSKAVGGLDSLELALHGDMVLAKHDSHKSK